MKSRTTAGSGPAPGGASRRPSRHRARLVAIGLAIVAPMCVGVSVGAAETTGGELARDVPQPGRIEPGARHRWTMAITSPEKVGVRLTPINLSLFVTVEGPDAASVQHATQTNGGAITFIFTAPTAGTYTATIWNAGAAAAVYEVTWTSAPDPIGTGATDVGTTQAGTTDTSGTQQGVLEMEPSSEGWWSRALGFLLRTAAPIAFVLVLQAVAVAVVRRTMGQRSGHTNPLPPPIGRSTRERQLPPLALLEVAGTSGIVLNGRSEARRRRVSVTDRSVLFGYLGTLVVAAATIGIITSSTTPGPSATDGTTQTLVTFGAGVGFIFALLMLGAVVVVGYVRWGLTVGPAAVITATIVAVPALVLAATWRLLAVVPWLVLLVGFTATFALRGRRSARTGKVDLLVLRVFGADASAATTFSTLTRSWRLLGRAVTIADPSFIRAEYSRSNKSKRWRLAIIGLGYASLRYYALGSSFEGWLLSHGYLTSLSRTERGRILDLVTYITLVPIAVVPVAIAFRSRFVRERDDLLARVRKLLTQSTRWHGSYPMRAIYCYDDLWRPVVQQMLVDAEVVLLDFRGFRPNNQGCAYETQKVVDCVPIHRVVVLLDDQTDHAVIFSMLHRCWSSMADTSPNLTAEQATLKIYTARHVVTWRQGWWPWLRSLPTRQRTWAEDADKVMALLSAAPDPSGASSLDGPPASSTRSSSTWSPPDGRLLAGAISGARAGRPLPPPSVPPQR